MSKVSGGVFDGRKLFREYTCSNEVFVCVQDPDKQRRPGDDVVVTLGLQAATNHCFDDSTTRT